MKSLLIHTVIGIYHFIAASLFIRHMHFELPKLQITGAERFRTTPPHTFMTLWNFTLLITVLTGYLLYDVLNVLNVANNLRKKLKRKLDFYFYSLVAPMTIFIVIIFWGMCFYDEKLMYSFPAELRQKILPSYLNHILHTFILVVVLIQTMCNRDVPFNFMKLVKGLTICQLAYAIWINIVNQITGKWPYPFLNKLQEPYRILLLLSFYCFAVLISFIFHNLNKLYCERNQPASKSRSKLHKKK